jgi:hypothetical protein
MNESHDPDEYEDENPHAVFLFLVKTFIYVLYIIAVYHIMRGRV